MQIVFWKPEYSVGVKSIDDDHRKLIDILNRFFEAMTKGQGKIIIGEIIKELEDYAFYHFNREETFFRLTNYPESDEHVKEHQFFKQKLMEMKKEVENGTSSTTPELLVFLRDWLLHHIVSVDKAYESHFRKYGIK